MRLLPLVLGLVLTGCSCAKKETSIFGDPLFVNGRRVTDDEIKLALIYGPCRPLLDLSKMGLVIEWEITRQSEERAGAEIATLEQQRAFPDPEARTQALAAARNRALEELHEKYRISDSAFDAEYAYNIDDFTKSYPTLDIGAEVCRAFRSVDSYRDQLRQTMCFDRVFLPTNPADWPTTTVEAIRSDKSGGELMIPDAQESYEARMKAAASNNGIMPREDPLLMTFLREMVRNAMFELMTIKTHSEGIDPKLAFWIDSNGDGKPEVALTIEELWNKVMDTVTEIEISEAKQWFITSLALRDRLAKDGALLTDGESQQAISELMKESDNSVVELEQMATKTYFFPSVECFTEYYKMREGYRRMIASKLVIGPDGALSPALSQYLDRANQVMGLGMVDCEALLVSAMDIGYFRWKKNGWTKAHQKALALRAEYDRDPTPQTWSRLMDENSEYWDPPPPTGKTNCADHKNKGRFGPRYRNDLIAYVGETPYSEWVNGGCITDGMFFDQVEGTVEGPFRGPLGWYLTRVIKRTPPSRPLKMSDPHHRQLLKDDYLRWSFSQYTKDAVARAKVRGWTPP